VILGRIVFTQEVDWAQLVVMLLRTEGMEEMPEKAESELKYAVFPDHLAHHLQIMLQLSEERSGAVQAL
jgi:hypothetical protein